VVGALCGDLELATAVLARSALGQPRLTPQALGALAGAGPAKIAADLSRLDELGLPSGWSPSHGLQGRQAESVRKMLLAMVSEPRLVLARLAEELVRLRHAGALAPDDRERAASAARAIFAPLASRLGVWQIKWELEDLAFRYLHPQEYRRIAAALSERRTDRERYIESFCAELRSELVAAAIAAEVYGRPKHIYSIHRKMQRKQLPFSRIFDVRAVRVVVDSVVDCYAALGVVQGKWAYLASEFDDYIATPKGNLYRSIHTAIVGPEGRIVEVQIRTREMHEEAERGVAAHWHYKEGGTRSRTEDRKIEAFRRLLEPGSSAPDRDFLESQRERLFADRIYALTPKGDVVEIITGKEPAPSRDWLSPELGYLASARSRAKVRAWFRRTQDGEPRTAGQTAGEREHSPATPPPRPRRRPAAASSPVRIMGMGDLPVTLARCCAPEKPQPIVGYLTAGRGVTIHSSGCRSLARMRTSRPQRILDADWTQDGRDTGR
ncbi:MAG: HD domain-containing protein, partial [Steroidobacteraceae bacterium]